MPTTLTVSMSLNAKALEQASLYSSVDRPTNDISVRRSNLHAATVCGEHLKLPLGVITRICVVSDTAFCAVRLRPTRYFS